MSTPSPSGDRYDVSDARRAELHQQADLHVKEGKPPFAGVAIQSWDEVEWIIAEWNWSTDIQLPEGKRRPDFRQARFISINLSGVSLYQADLSGADCFGVRLSYAFLEGAIFCGANLRSAQMDHAFLDGANLSEVDGYDVNLYKASMRNIIAHNAKLNRMNGFRAILSNADFTGTDLTAANLFGAHLASANLIGASLRGVTLIGADLSAANLTGVGLGPVNLSGANLSEANLTGVGLREANLSDANFTRALLNTETVLDDITLDTHTKVSGVRWNGAPLNGITWANAPRLGDEPDPKDFVGKRAKVRVTAFRNAARAYNGLSVALRDQGLTYAASKYRLCELAMMRKALRAERNVGGWFINVLLDAVAGNGEKPGRAFVAYLGIVTFFAAIYWGVANFLHTSTPHLQWYEAVVLSLTSFHGRGFFPGAIQLSDPLAIVAALEAVSGLFIELVFIATFSRRFLGN